MPTANVNGTVLAYEELGSGDPLVFVHGSASDHRTWNSQKEAFAEQFRVISYSRRYHWPNETIPEGTAYTMGEHVDDLQALIQALDAGPAHLVGNSYGAFLCLLLAIRNASLVRTLVLAEPPVLTMFVSNNPTPLELLKVLLTRPRTAVGIVRLGAQGIDPATKAFEQGIGKAASGRFWMQCWDPEPTTACLNSRKSRCRTTSRASRRNCSDRGSCR